METAVRASEARSEAAVVGAVLRYRVFTVGVQKVRALSTLLERLESGAGPNGADLACARVSSLPSYHRLKISKEWVSLGDQLMC